MSNIVEFIKSKERVKAREVANFLSVTIPDALSFLRDLQQSGSVELCDGWWRPTLSEAEVAEQMQERDRLAGLMFRFIDQRGAVLTKDIAGQFNVSEREVHVVLAEMLKSGKLFREAHIGRYHFATSINVLKALKVKPQEARAPKAPPKKAVKPKKATKPKKEFEVKPVLSLTQPVAEPTTATEMNLTLPTLPEIEKRLSDLSIQQKQLKDMRRLVKLAESLGVL